MAEPEAVLQKGFDEVASPAANDEYLAAINRPPSQGAVRRTLTFHALPTTAIRSESSLPEIQALTSSAIKWSIQDAGYRGYSLGTDYKFKVHVAGQKSGMTQMIKRLMRRHSAIRPDIGRHKAEHLMDRNHLANAQGDAANALLAAAGCNFSILLRWLRILLLKILAGLAGRQSLTIA